MKLSFYDAFIAIPSRSKKMRSEFKTAPKLRAISGAKKTSNRDMEKEMLQCKKVFLNSNLS